MNPLVSVIVPAYNAAAYLEAAVRSALDQDYEPLEVVVVDDGSTDGTAAVLDRLARSDERVIAVYQANAGESAARNAAARVARGEYHSYLDADDLFLPGKLARQVAHLRAHPGCDLVYSDFLEADESLRPRRELRINLHGLSEDTALVYRNLIPPSVVTLRAALARAAGEFDPAFRISADWDYWVRCSRIGRLCHLPAVLSVRRLHAAQITGGADIVERMWRSHVQMAEKLFRDPPGRYRAARAAHHWIAAGGHRQHGNYLRLIPHLVRFAYFAGSPGEALRLVRTTRALSARGGNW